MTGRSAFRLGMACLVAAAGVSLALIGGAPLAPALLALAAGMLALLLAQRAVPEAAALRSATEEPAGPVLPGINDLLQAMDDPMLVVRDRRVVAANSAARHLLGDHIEGTDVRLAIRHPAAAERLAETPEAGSGVTRTDLVGLGAPDRTWSMLTAILSDGSRLVRLSDLSEAHAAERMRADFVANASHELRTPLATLLGFLETLEDEEAAGDPETRRRFLGIMFNEARRMRALVDDLISLSRIEAERYAAPPGPVDLLTVIDHVKSSVSAIAQAQDAGVEVENHARSTIVPGDRSQLAQMLNNLVSNAIHYGRRGRPVRIRIDESPGGMIRIAVIDEGEGIAAEHIPRLTERFYRVDAGRSRAVGGTGLGLAISKHIALRHRGRLEILSQPGKGTSVRVFLPRLDPPSNPV